MNRVNRKNWWQRQGEGRGKGIKEFTSSLDVSLYSGMSAPGRGQFSGGRDGIGGYIAW